MPQDSLFESKLDTKFSQFHADNPQVYAILLRLARQAKERGRRKIGIGMLFEVVRWEMFLKTSDADYKLNNNYRSRYARLIMQLNPELDGIFETRGLHT
jgi:hypothetical protein